MQAVHIDVWSDYVCPFCYLVEPGLQKLAEQDGPVELRWRAFELRPEPVPTLDPQGDYLREAWSNSVLPMAAQRGMILRLPSVQPRSRLAHEATAFAATQGKAAQMSHAIFRAFFEHDVDIGKMEELAKIGAGTGLDPAALVEALQMGQHRGQVMEDQELAESFELSGVPAVVFRPAGADWNRALLVSGAQPYEVLRGALEQVRSRHDRA